MIPKINKILYATDLSKNSAYAFRYAMNSAINHDASLIILHVREDIPPSALYEVRDYVGEDKLEELRKERQAHSEERIKKRLDEFCKKELKDRPECLERIESIEVVEGYPVEVILDMADNRNCDVIIMGDHGKGFLRHAFLGSTAEKVLRRTNKPVFIIPLPSGDTDISFSDI